MVDLVSTHDAAKGEMAKGWVCAELHEVVYSGIRNVPCRALPESAAADKSLRGPTRSPSPLTYKEDV